MNVRKTCFNFYWGIKKVIAPNLKYSQTIYEDVLQKNSLNKRYWLDLGCGHQLLPPWRLDQERELVKNAKVLVGLDYDLAALKKHKTICCRVQGDILRLPFADNFFDLVTSNMVFEHLRDPRNQLKEVNRILKPGGTLIFHTPNVLSYSVLVARLIPEIVKNKAIHFLQDRGEEDIFPTYYRINSIKAIKDAAGLAGLELKKIKFIVSSPELVMMPPLVVMELVLIRILMLKLCRPFRTNIIALLRKPSMNLN